MILDTSKYVGPCACGRDHELRTKLVVCEHGALKNFDKYMEDAGLSGFRTKRVMQSSMRPFSLCRPLASSTIS